MCVYLYMFIYNYTYLYVFVTVSCRFHSVLLLALFFNASLRPPFVTWADPDVLFRTARNCAGSGTHFLEKME
jgi:hypothetical protein